MTSKSAEFPAIMASPMVNVELRTTPFLGPRYARRNGIWAFLETIYQNNRRALTALDRTGRSPCDSRGYAIRGAEVGVGAVAEPRAASAPSWCYALPKVWL